MKGKEKKMKIISTKTYNKLLDNEYNMMIENNRYKELIDMNNKLIEKLSNKIKELNDSNKIKDAHIKKIQEEFSNFKEYATMYESKLEKEVNSLKKSKGGFKKEINKQRKKVEELEIKLKESMTDKYLVHKLPPVKAKPTFKAKIKDSSKTSNIMKNLHKED